MHRRFSGAPIPGHKRSQIRSFPAHPIADASSRDPIRAAAAGRRRGGPRGLLRDDVDGALGLPRKKGVGRGGMIAVWQKFDKFAEMLSNAGKVGSFSAVSAPIFATKYMYASCKIY